LRYTLLSRIDRSRSAKSLLRSVKREEWHGRLAGEITRRMRVPPLDSS
jgi:hypothetical protein